MRRVGFVALSMCWVAACSPAGTGAGDVVEDRPAAELAPELLPDAKPDTPVDSELLIEAGDHASPGDDAVQVPADTPDGPDVSPQDLPVDAWTDLFAVADTPPDTAPEAASEATDLPPNPGAVDYGARGPFPVGNTTFWRTDPATHRSFLVEVWYPAAPSEAAASDAGEPVGNFVPGGMLRDLFESWLSAAPPSCPTRQTRSARDALPAVQSDGWPLVVFSHCWACFRFSGFSIAEHLASHGIAVAAPDHPQNTGFDLVAGQLEGIGEKFLAVRAGDIRATLDVLLDATAGEVPERVRGRFDPQKVGVFGHSYGSATAGRVIRDDPRPIAAAGLAAPFDGSLLSAVDPAALPHPVLFLVAQQDNSIGESGNAEIRANYLAASHGAWKVEVQDAGHWSVSDICGLSSIFMAGCGSGLTQSPPGNPFVYLPVATGIGIAQRVVTRFFAAYLLGDPDAIDQLQAPDPSGFASTEWRL